MEQLNDTNFQSVVIDSGKKVLVDFSAEWCGPCRMVEPVLEEMSKSHKDVEFKRVNIDDYEYLAQQYGVMSIPCMVLFDGGKEVSRVVGFRSREELEKMIGE